MAGGLSDIDDPGGHSPDDLFVALGDGRGRFRVRSVALPEPVPLVHMVATGDLNRDRRLDVVVLEHEDARSAPHGTQEWLRIGLGDGHGRFTLLPRLGPFASPRTDELATSVSVADLDGDQILDAVMTGAIFTGRGDGTFEYAPANIEGDPELADLDADGRLDVAFFNADACALTTSISARAWGPALCTEYGRPVPVIADFGGDGRPDVLALLTIRGTPVLLYRGDGRGGFAWPAPVAHEVHATGTVTADFDGDDTIDIAILGYERGVTISVRFTTRASPTAEHGRPAPA